MDSDTSQTVVLYNLIDWADKNRQKVIIGVGAIVLVAVVVTFANWSARERETAANNELFALPSMVGPSGVKAPPDPAGYLKVASDRSGTSAGERAAVLAGGQLFALEKYAEAQKQFDQFLASHSDSVFRAQAMYGSATSLEAQNKTNEAVTRYLELTRNYPTDPVVDPTRLALARIYEGQGKLDEALKLYDLIARPNAMSAWSSEAAERREYLLQKNPKLAASVTPVVTSSNAVPFKAP